MTDKTTAHVLCGNCKEPVYYEDDGSHKCLGCKADEDTDIPDGWRIMSKKEIIDRAGEYL